MKQHLDLCLDIERRKNLRHRQESGPRNWHHRRRGASLHAILALIGVLFFVGMLALLIL